MFSIFICFSNCRLTPPPPFIRVQTPGKTFFCFFLSKRANFSISQTTNASKYQNNTKEQKVYKQKNAKRRRKNAKAKKIQKINPIFPSCWFLIILFCCLLVFSKHFFSLSVVFLYFLFFLFVFSFYCIVHSFILL